ncbi:MAG: hypothetical protein B6I18_04705 [Bacteroidetes bacterium 4572_112]|nr:MAG: hypothetical protein B6I18_04705 [Bacteroidetes bacterium 4572_112]
MDKTNTELTLLKLNNKLKKIIFRENRLQELFEQVCNIIPHKDIFDSAWIISNNNNTVYYANKKTKILTSKEISNCYDIIINNNISNKKTHLNNFKVQCKTCSIGCNNSSSYIISSPLIYKDLNYGLIAISVNNKNIELKSLHYELLKDLADDIAYQAYIINTEKKLKIKKEELLDSNTKFQTIANLYNGSITIFDFNYELLFASSNTISILNKLGSSLPLNLHDVINSYEIKILDKNLELLKSGKVNVVTLKHDFTKVLGYPLILKTRSSILRNNNTELVLSIIEDITKNTLTTKQNKEFEITYSSIFEEAPMGITIMDKDGIITNVNKEECNIIGYTKEELTGAHITKFFKKKYISEFKSNFKKFISKGNIEVEIELIKKDGSTIRVRRIAKGIYDSNDELKEIISHTQNITEHYNTNQKLRVLSQAIDQSPAIIAISDLDNKIIYVNKKFTKVTGYSSKEAIGNKPEILRSNYHSDEFYKNIWNHLRENRQWSGDFYNKRKNNEHYWERAEISPFFNKEGKHHGFIKTGEDITKLVETENKLKDSIKSYVQIFELIPIPIIIHKNGEIFELNKAALDFANGEHLENSNKSEYIGQNIMKFVHSNNHMNIINRMKLLQKTHKQVPMSTELLINSKGETRDVEIVSAPIKYKGIEATMVAFEDITNRLEGTRKLQESENKFHSIYDTNPDAIIIIRLFDAKILDINKGFLDISKYSPEDVLGKTPSEVGIYHDTRKLRGLVFLLKKGRFINNQEVQFSLKDGSKATGLVSARIININKEKVALFVVKNITERIKIEKELLKAKEKAEENDQLKSAFLANMSHEIRNPLNAIIGFSDLLKDDDLSKEDINKYIDIIQNKGDDLLVLINDIIDVSKIESGVLKVENNKINIVDTINETSQNYKRVFKDNKIINFAVNINTNKDIYIIADNTRLNQVFNNLIENAIKFTNKGEISITLDSDDHNVIIKVKDTGIGISKSDYQKIFDRFIKLESKQIISGAGLGLNIVKSLVELMKGTISVSSELNIGTEFTISFPRL